MKNNNDIITTDDILGKDVVDPDGTNLGLITQVHMDRNEMCMTGITVDMGLLKPDLYIGVNNIKHIGPDAILLNKVPTEKFKGLTVLSEEGKIIGKVRDIILDGKNVKEFVVKGRGLFEKGMSIGYRDIKEIGDKIILKAERAMKK